LDGISDFPLAEVGRMSISAAMGRAEPEMTLPFDVFTFFLWVSLWNFSSISDRLKSYSIFSISTENAL
jgi:hypothetical protein